MSAVEIAIHVIAAKGLDASDKYQREAIAYKWFNCAGCAGSGGRS
jgi:hypothetical protein